MKKIESLSSAAEALVRLAADEPAHFYLRRPTADTKDRFTVRIAAR